MNYELGDRVRRVLETPSGPFRHGMEGTVMGFADNNDANIQVQWDDIPKIKCYYHSDFLEKVC